MTAHPSTEIRTLWVTRAEYALIAEVSERTIFDWEAKGVGPMPNRDVPGVCLYPRHKVENFVAQRNGPPSAKPAPAKPRAGLAEHVPLTASTGANHVAVNAALEADRRRARMILCRAPESYKPAAFAAIKSGASLEAFDASLPGELRALMPPLHRFIADFDRPADGGDATADSIMSAAQAARGN